jgi:hypothetical protein
MSRNQVRRAERPTRPAGRRKATPSAGWTGTIIRLIFGVIFGIDAYLKWLPGFRKTYISQLKSPLVEPVIVGKNQPHTAGDPPGR